MKTQILYDFINENNFISGGCDLDFVWRWFDNKGTKTKLIYDIKYDVFSLETTGIEARKVYYKQKIDG